MKNIDQQFVVGLILSSPTLEIVQLVKNDCEVDLSAATIILCRMLNRYAHNLLSKDMDHLMARIISESFVLIDE